jgi:hypothetical protein
MHSDGDDVPTPTPNQRLHAVARILAAGILRLRARAALPSAELPAPRILPEKAVNPLDVSAETRLSDSSS